MKVGNINAVADQGKRFILTGYGYKKTPEDVKAERKIGEPVRGFEQRVPVSWVRKGYVKEV